MAGSNNKQVSSSGIDLTKEEKLMLKEPTCCGCIEINKGMRILGYITFLNCLQNLIVGVIGLCEGKWMGLVSLLISIPLFILGNNYYLWFQ